MSTVRKVLHDMIAPRDNLQDIASRAEAIYERSLRTQLVPAHNGEFLVINADMGEYELDPDDVQATRRARQRFPSAPLFTIRVGHTTAYRIAH